MFSCCPTEETKGQELNLQQINPPGKCVLNMVTFSAHACPGAQEPAAGTRQRFPWEEVTQQLAVTFAWRASLDSGPCSLWRQGVCVEEICCGNVSGQRSWNHFKSLYFSVNFFSKVEQNLFKQQNNSICSLINLLCLKLSCMQRRQCASTG